MKCFIIHLPNIKSSLNSALKLKKQLEDFNHEVTMFEGTPGDEAVKIFEQQNIKLLGDFLELEKKEKYFLKCSMPGVKGCFYSRYKFSLKKIICGAHAVRKRICKGIFFSR